MVELTMSGVGNEAIGWTAPPAKVVLGSAEVHVWALPLDAWPEDKEELAACLSPNERARAARFHFEHHRSRWMTCRALLRTMLARYLEVSPAALGFELGPFGKPSLAGPSRLSGLHFNLSHSDNLGLLAVTWTGPVGVDVERIRLLQDADDLVARFFSKRETAAFQALPVEQKPAAFFNLWTRKEAWLKATGEGIGHSLHLVEVSFLPGEAAELLSLPPSLAQRHSWSVHDVSPSPEFAAAVACASKGIRLNCWTWREPGARGVQPSTRESQPGL